MRNRAAGIQRNLDGLTDRRNRAIFESFPRNRHPYDDFHHLTVDKSEEAPVLKRLLAESVSLFAESAALYAECVSLFAEYATLFAESGELYAEGSIC